ncbi:hypothetical protein J3R83DRAFT_4401 [Lanmaoa asiatica]|nr:hypothetical protein J3R83DRAFT_4401 [Lanmaoa asiatica]
MKTISSDLICAWVKAMLLSARSRPSSGGLKTWLAFPVPRSGLSLPVSGRTGFLETAKSHNRSLAAQPPSTLYMKQRCRWPHCFGNCSKPLRLSPSHTSSSCLDSTQLGDISITIHVQRIEFHIRIFPDAQCHFTVAQKGAACSCSSTSLRILYNDHYNMAWTSIVEYKTRLRMRTDDTRITSPKPPDNDMPTSSAPFITPSGLVTFQHDLKARINSSPLVKVPLTMRPLVKKRSSIPFSLTLKRHSTTIFSRSSSSSSNASASADCTPASEMMDPMAATDVAVGSPSETPLHITPSIGTKIMDRFWPEDEGPYSEENCRVPIPSRYPAALAPPPHHRRAPRSLGSICDVPFRCVVRFAEPLSPRSDQLPSRTSSEHSTGPLRFPF